MIYLFVFCIHVGIYVSLYMFIVVVVDASIRQPTSEITGKNLIILKPANQKIKNRYQPPKYARFLSCITEKFPRQLHR